MHSDKDVEIESTEPEKVEGESSITLSVYDKDSKAGKNQRQSAINFLGFHFYLCFFPFFTLVYVGDEMISELMYYFSLVTLIVSVGLYMRVQWKDPGYWTPSYEGETKPVRSVYCKHCDRICLMHDHHCYFVGKCIGEKNKDRFFVLTNFQVINSIMYVLYCFLFLYRYYYFVGVNDSAYFYYPYMFALFGNFVCANVMLYQSYSWWYVCIWSFASGLTFYEMDKPKKPKFFPNLELNTETRRSFFDRGIIENTKLHLQILPQMKEPYEWKLPDEDKVRIIHRPWYVRGCFQVLLISIYRDLVKVMNGQLSEKEKNRNEEEEEEEEEEKKEK